MRVMSRAVLVLAATLFAAPAFAQMSFNVAAGAAIPVGSTADGLKMGYNATVGLGIKPPIAPLGIRIEGMWNQFDIKGTPYGSRILALTANATLSGAGMPLPMGYLIGGVGLYNAKVTNLPSAVTSTSSSKAGFNIGAGLNFPLTGFSTYLEARLHFVTSDPSTKFIPVVFGLRF